MLLFDVKPAINTIYNYLIWVEMMVAITKKTGIRNDGYDNSRYNQNHKS